MALSTMRVSAASRVAVARTKTVKVVARGSWREPATVTAQPAGRSSSANRTSPTRSVLPANWRQELESLRNGNGSSAAAPAPAPTPAASSAPSRSPKKPTTPTRSALPANWKQELESLRGGSSSSASSTPPSAAPVRPSSSPKKAVTPNRSALPPNWREELASLRGSASPAAAAEPAAPVRSSSVNWRSEGPAASPAAPSRSPKKSVTPTRSSLPANWKQELESMRGGSSPAPSAAPEAPARSSSASWRTESKPAASGNSDKIGTNPWTGKTKVEIKRTPLPADWRSKI